VLSETEWGPKYSAKVLAIAAHGLRRQWFSGFKLQARLGIEQINVTRPAPHEQKDDALGTRA
jgi:hypothetical protein